MQYCFGINMVGLSKSNVHQKQADLLSEISLFLSLCANWFNLDHINFVVELLFLLLFFLLFVCVSNVLILQIYSFVFSFLDDSEFISLYCKSANLVFVWILY